MERSIEDGVVKAKETLAELVSRGLVVKHKGGDARTHYRINQNKYEEIQAFPKQRK
jgi:hypothetical protein